MICPKLGPTVPAARNPEGLGRHHLVIWSFRHHDEVVLPLSEIKALHLDPQLLSVLHIFLRFLPKLRDVSDALLG
jgi:hypothetical protein